MSEQPTAQAEEPRRPSRVKRFALAALGWFFGILFVLYGVVGMLPPEARPKSAAMVLLMGLLVFPPMRRLAHATTGLSLSTKARASSLVVLWIGYSVFFIREYDERTRAAEERADQAVQEELHVREMTRALRDLMAAQEMHFADNVAYTEDFPSSVYKTPNGVTGPTITLTPDGWHGWVGHRLTSTTCAVYVGSTLLAPAFNEGEVGCTTIKAAFRTGPEPAAHVLHLDTGDWQCAYECGRARWAIKTLSDWQADQVRIDSVVETTIEALAALSMPETWPDQQRIGAVERTVFRLTGDIVEWSIQADRDVHIVIASPERPYVTMIAEIPDPPCWGACESNVAPTYYRLQQVFMARLCDPDCTTRNTLAVPVRARFTGVGFFDRPHTTTGAAPNYIELHPLLDLEFVN